MSANPWKLPMAARQPLYLSFLLPPDCQASRTLPWEAVERPPAVPFMCSWYGWLDLEV